jgi:hypothetical protein
MRVSCGTHDGGDSHVPEADTGWCATLDTNGCMLPVPLMPRQAWDVMPQRGEEIHVVRAAITVTEKDRREPAGSCPAALLGGTVRDRRSGGLNGRRSDTCISLLVGRLGSTCTGAS